MTYSPVTLPATSNDAGSGSFVGAKHAGMHPMPWKRLRSGFRKRSSVR